jgi:hypothetical protein
MGIQDHMQDVDMTDTLNIGVWTRSGGAIRISGTQSACSNNYQYVGKRRNIGEVKSTDRNGRRHDSSKISLRGTKIKGQSLA